MKNRRHVRLIGWSFGGLLALMLIPILGVFAWVATGPREIDWLTPTIEKALSQPGQSFTVSVDHTVVGWNGFSKPMQITILNARMIQDGITYVTLPAIQVDMDLASLLLGRLGPDQVTVLKPDLDIYQDAQGVMFLLDETGRHRFPIAVFFDKQEAEAAAVSQPEPIAEDEIPLFAGTLDELAIVQANLHLKSDLADAELTIPAAHIILRYERDGLSGIVSATTEYDGKPTSVAADFHYHLPEDRLELKLALNNLNPARYADINPALEPLGHLRLALSGLVEVDTTLSGTVNSASFDLTGSNGQIVYDEFFAAPLTLQHVLLKGAIEQNLQRIRLDTVAIDLGKPKITASGVVDYPLGQIGITGQARVTDIYTDALAVFWPKGAAASVRDWVTSNVRGGYIPQADFTFNAAPGQLQMSPIPDAAINGAIRVEDALISYMPGYPEAREVTGTVTLTGNSLKVDAVKAVLLDDAHLTAPGSVIIPSFGGKTVFDITLPIAASARDTATFLAATPLQLGEGVKLDPATISGEISGTVGVKITPTDAEKKSDQVDLSIVAHVADLAQPDVYGDHDITGLSGDLDINGERIAFDGSGQMDGTPLAANLSFADETLALRLKGTLPWAMTSEFDADLSPYLGQEVGIDGAITTKAGEQRFSATLDLTPTDLHVKDVDLAKAAGTPGSLFAKGTITPQNVTVDHFDLSLPSGVAKGALTYDRAEKRVASAKLTDMTLNDNDFSGEYTFVNNRTYRLIAEGQRIDLRFLLDKAGDAKAKERASRKLEIPSLDLQTRFEEMQLTDDKKITTFRGRLRCTAIRCYRLIALGKAQNAPFIARISKQGETRVLTAYTPDAGALLGAFDLYDNMRGGEMTVQGVYQDDKPDQPLVGRLEIGKHRIVGAPVLARLLTVATFTGIGDALDGKGLSFAGLVAPFSFRKFVLRLNDAKTAGNSIGITASGNINFVKERLDLNGTVIPAYYFNDLLAKIPLLGKVYSALAGDGLVAVKYSLDGPLDEPDIDVNPLSALTPGFLRNFFNIFDSREDAEGMAASKVNLDEMQEAITKVDKDFPRFKSWIEMQKTNPDARPEDTSPTGKEQTPEEQAAEDAAQEAEEQNAPASSQTADPDEATPKPTTIPPTVPNHKRRTILPGASHAP